jgi:pimeloyl-ACP methyl ester carboxylesterase
MPTSVINGVRLYYEHHGDSGEPLVFVHGYTGDISDWKFPLAEFSPDYRILVLDLRGHGQSEAPSDRSAYSIVQMAADVEALVNEIGFQRYHLVGHSMGGAIVQEIALRSPQSLLSLTLEDTASKFGVDTGDDEMTEWRKKRYALAMSEGLAAAAALPMPNPPPHMPAERLKEVERRLARLSLDAFVGAMVGLLEWEGTEARAAAISTPTLIIYGDIDSPSIIEPSRRLAETIPNATVAVIPESGHSPQWERPDLFNKALRRHLEAHRAAG